MFAICVTPKGKQPYMGRYRDIILENESLGELLKVNIAELFSQRNMNGNDYHWVDIFKLGIRKFASTPNEKYYIDDDNEIVTWNYANGSWDVGHRWRYKHSGPQSVPLEKLENLLELLKDAPNFTSIKTYIDGLITNWHEENNRILYWKQLEQEKEDKLNRIWPGFRWIFRG